MAVPLSRDRDYRLLWVSQALSGAGFNASMIAFPLLVLAVTGSPAITGLVLGVGAIAQVVVGLPGGALVDRWNRKKMMLAAEAAQALAVASLVLALWLEIVGVPHMVVVAETMGVCNALFGPAERRGAGPNRAERTVVDGGGDGRGPALGMAAAAPRAGHDAVRGEPELLLQRLLHRHHRLGHPAWSVVGREPPRPCPTTNVGPSTGPPKST